MKTLLAPCLALVASLAPALAHADCERDADRLRAHLEEAEINTGRWNLGWSIGFGVAAAGQLGLALAEYNPFGDYTAKYRDTLLVGSAKATIGFLSRIVVPLRVRVPPRDADRCSELAALRVTIKDLARREKQIFWMTHLGGTALNLAGVAVLWLRNDFKAGAISFAMAYPVGIASAYTLPRASWKLWRAEGASWSVAPTEGGAALTFGGSF